MKSLAIRIYRRLAYAFPHEFQMIYGADLLQLGEDSIDDIWARLGFFGLFRLLVDIAMRLPLEYLSEMRRDVAYALRTLSKSRGFAAIGIASLGLGIGIATISASEFLNLILRDMPGAKNPDQLVILTGTSYPYFEHFRNRRDLFAGAAAYQGPIPFNISFQSSAGGAANATPQRTFGHLVSPEYFSVIGVEAARGRTFDPQIDKPGGAPVVFISDRFWRERMGADPGVVSRAIRVNGQTATIVGIGPKDFLGVSPVTPAEVFVSTTSPAAMVPELAGDVLHKREIKSFNGLFRLAPGVTLRSAEAALDALTRQLDSESLDPARHAKGRRVMVAPGGKMAPIPREVLPMVAAMMILLDGLVIGIACMNLANMQLARATARRREVAIRLSVGASRFRLIRQLLTESVLLASAGGFAGHPICLLGGRRFQEDQTASGFSGQLRYDAGLARVDVCVRRGDRRGHRIRPGAGARHYAQQPGRHTQGRRAGAGARLPPIRPAQPADGFPGGWLVDAVADCRFPGYRIPKQQSPGYRVQPAQYGAGLARSGARWLRA